MRSIAGFALGVGLAFVSVGAAAEPFDASLYDSLLLRHTREVSGSTAVRVDYRGLAGSEGWPRLLAQLAASDSASLQIRDEKLAFWINAYNILAIDLVVANRPPNSIRDIGNFFQPVWKRDAGTVGGERVSLDQIEHAILRPLGEPRIHAAIVCASISCPPLLRQAWTAAALPEQFAVSFRSWLANPATGLRIDSARGTLFLSRVFDWFEADFAAAGGVLAVIDPYLGEETRAWLAQNPAPRIRYLAYDWSLNAVALVEAGD